MVVTFIVPSVSVEGSTLNFTCTLTGESVVSTCDPSGQWTPDPETYDCSGKEGLSTIKIMVSLLNRPS